MRLWGRKSIPVSRETNTENQQMLDLCQMNNLQGAIELAMQNVLKKSYTLSDFVGMEDFNDTGGHFGTEFNLGSNAGRLKSMYSREPWTYATATLIARTLSSIPFIVIDEATDEIVENHPLCDLLNASNEIQDNTSLKWVSFLDLILGGNSFLVFDEKYRSAIHVPVEYVNIQLREGSCGAEGALKREQEGPISHIEIQGPAMCATGSASNRIEYKNVVHHKFPNPFNPFYGMSMFVAAVRPILLDRHKNEFEMAFYLRGATNAGVIETTQDISKARMDRLMRTFEQAFTGKRNWWRTLFLPKGAKWVNSGLTMKDMEHLEGLRENRRTLLAVLGIPPTKVGVVEDVNRSTSEVQDRTFYENTIIPLAKFWANGWNSSYLVRQIYPGYRIEPDLSGVEAVEGSLTSRGEAAQQVDKYLVINEIRQDILGYEPLKETDPRGNMFVAEIKPAMADPFGGPMTDPDPGDMGPEDPDLAEPTPAEDDPTDDDTDKQMLDGGTRKAQATESQSRTEKRQMRKYVKALDRYLGVFLSQVEYALRNQRDVRKYLDVHQDERVKVYVSEADPVLMDSQERGFTLGTHNAKTFSVPRVGRKQALTFDPVDLEAIEILREKDRDGKRQTLRQRNLTTFKGFDQTRTEIIMDIIERSLADGRTEDEIARTIRGTYDDNYSGQAQTIARTEVLSAVSAGIQWNHEVLGQVFSEVNKQWFHVGDVGANPDAREEHAAFENAGKNGVVPSSYEWENPTTGAKLRYPRDPQAGAKDVINCRCTMVTVIPETATSNAPAILDTE